MNLSIFLLATIPKVTYSYFYFLVSGLRNQKGTHCINGDGLSYRSNKGGPAYMVNCLTFYT